MAMASAGEPFSAAPSAPGTSARLAIPPSADLGPMLGGFGLQTKAHLRRIYTNHTETGWGIVHFYREVADSSVTDKLVDITNAEEPSVADEEECLMVCLPTVPNYMGHADMCEFLGDRWLEETAHIRMVTTRQVDAGLTLVKFREGRKARDFRKEFNGRKFMADKAGDICHVVFLKSITFEMTDVPAVSSATANGSSSTSPLELPTCPVCLERMDDTGGLITIACQHVFHCTCLKKWSTGGCPVCRFASPLADILPSSEPFGRDVSNICSVCNTAEDLWICLICGHVGCGRYKGGHAKEHWTQTAHHFALEIETQHVWDYADDKWVHRLIREKGNGKLVEFDTQLSSQAPSSGSPVAPDDSIIQEKLDAIGIEYMQIFIAQLDTQRHHYEGLLKQAKERTQLAETAVEKSNASVINLQAQLSARESRAISDAERLKSLERDLDREKRRADKAQDLARSLGKQLQEEKQVTAGLMARVQHLDKKNVDANEKVKKLAEELADTKEMNRDLSAFISAQEQVQQMKSNGELDEGEIEGGTVSAPGKKNRRKK